MDYSEKDIEEIIYEDTLYGMELEPIGRQVQTEFGVIDILALTKANDGKYGIVVIEIKKGVIDESAFGQVMRYVGCIRELVSHWKVNEKTSEILKNKIVGARGLLIGKECTDGVALLTRNFPVDFMKYNACMSVSLDYESYSRSKESLFRDDNKLSPLIFDKLDELIFIENTSPKEGANNEERQLSDDQENIQSSDMEEPS